MGRSEENLAAEIVRLYCDEGLSIGAVAQEVGWSASAVYSRLVALGVPTRRPWAHNAVECDPVELARLYIDEGLSSVQLPDSTGAR